ncbi:hypothetical protein TASIC1_0021000300 [Trichoderma asperellum]|uniref:Uncharacterized protein n=1 Tax=Trichoderma asperellum TaxID=101201 RepID=A0A6V8R8W8_TRIAP|nr:hypothetical protein LI328DRAFT_162257 [Trichoderma asperelloides]GFP60556.1 hypothetical protein TASIC1_0021000300 [Trichoderma asperellum]
MRILLFLAIAHLSAIAWAGGYAGCLERVMFFQAYEIDGLLPTGRSIGYWCLKWISQRNICKAGQWRACNGDLEGGRCTFEQFMKQIHPDTPNPQQWPVYEDDPKAKPGAKPKLDVKETALNCLKAHRAANEDIVDIAPYRVMKGGGKGYGAAVKELGRRVDSRWQALTAVAKIENRPAFTVFDNAVDEIIRARRGDTGKRMYDAAMQLEQDENVTIKAEDLGPNPDPDETDPAKKEWKEVNWPETTNLAVEHGIEDAENKLRQWVRTYIFNDPSATTHRNMMKKFKEVVTGRNLCR